MASESRAADAGLVDTLALTKRGIAILLAIRNVAVGPRPSELANTASLLVRAVAVAAASDVALVFRAIIADESRQTGALGSVAHAGAAQRAGAVVGAHELRAVIAPVAKGMSSIQRRKWRAVAIAGAIHALAQARAHVGAELHAAGGTSAQGSALALAQDASTALVLSVAVLRARQILAPVALEAGLTHADAVDTVAATRAVVHALQHAVLATEIHVACATSASAQSSAVAVVGADRSGLRAVCAGPLCVALAQAVFTTTMDARAVARTSS